MFETDLSASHANAVLGLTDPLDQTQSGFPASINAYGLDATATHREPLSAMDSLGTSWSIGGTLLIQGGTTTAAEINEVNTLLDSSRYNRDDLTGHRGYTNYRYYPGDSRALLSANELVGSDRGDYLTNAINVGTVVYRSHVNVSGDIGFTSSGSRDSEDYFQFTAGKTGTYTLSLTGLTQNVGLALYDANSRLITWSDQNGNSNEMISGTLSAGTYIARIYSATGDPWFHGATGYNLRIERAADAQEQAWQSLLADSSVENAALNSIKYDNTLSREDVIGIIKSAGDFGSVTSTELTDLRKFYDEAINTPSVAEDVKVLAQKVLFTDTSNQWYTGSDSIRDSLGNLAAGSSTTHLNLLLGKHFLGTDRPAIHRDASNNLMGSYTRANGSLFIGGADANDIVQGATGDCYFLAALAGTANDKPSLISDMFRDNGDGTWTVRFFTEGKVDYVTVDRMMPTNAWGNYIYANMGQSVAGNNELWVALAEKAYAQVNESGRIGQDGTNFYGNGNDNGIGWGFSGAATKHITNLNTSTEGLTNFDILGWSPFGLDRGELISLVNANRVVTIGGFNENATDSDAGPTSISTAVRSHAYSITHYDSTTGRFTVLNPWGVKHLSLTFDQLMALGGWITYSNS